MPYEINLIEMPDQPTLIMKTITPVEKLPEFFGRAYGGIMAYLGELGENPTGMPFGAYFNLDMTALIVEAGFPVNKKFEDKGDVKSGIIPGGKFISTLHRGAYDSVGPAYDALTNWAKENGYEPTGIAYEYYLNDPTESPAVIPETEIRLSLK